MMTITMLFAIICLLPSAWCHLMSTIVVCIHHPVFSCLTAACCTCSCLSIVASHVPTLLLSLPLRVSQFWTAEQFEPLIVATHDPCCQGNWWRGTIWMYTYLWVQQMWPKGIWSGWEPAMSVLAWTGGFLPMQKYGASSATGSQQGTLSQDRTAMRKQTA